MMLATSPLALHRYDALLRLLADVGRGGTLSDLGAAYTLAQELERPELDLPTLASLTARLGLQVADLNPTTLGDTP
ncbi:MAG: hypothetical protein Q8N53_16865 [Longimicrobiales bacterium]|nr:hypothetical protein [Longimicrobiales bacterium]